MKVVFISSLYAPNEIGGAERAVRILAERHAASGSRSVVITLAKDGVARRDEVGGVTVYYVPLSNIGFLHGDKPLSKWQRMGWHLLDSFNIPMMVKVYRILKSERPDIVEANNLQGFSVSAWLAAERLKIPIVQVLHDYYLGCVNSSMHKRGKNCSGQCLACHVLCTPRRWLDTLPEAVSSVSHRTFQCLTRHGVFRTSKRVVITPSALRFGDLQTASSRADRRAGDQLVLGFIGRIDPTKGVETLLVMLKHLPDLDVRVVIGGQGDLQYIDSLKSRYRDRRIEFLGFTKPSEFYSFIDVLVVPSIWEEPRPRVIGEAQSNGIPAIVSRIGGLPEAIEEGANGFTFDVGNAVDLSKVVSKIHRLDYPSGATRKACLASAREYEVENVYRRHCDLWRSSADLTGH